MPSEVPERRRARLVQGIAVLCARLCLCHAQADERLIGWLGETHRTGGAREGAQVDDDCVDKMEECPNWYWEGECDNNPDYMRQNCPFSCEVCRKSRAKLPAAAAGAGAPPIETVTLNNGVRMPRVGFGTAGLGCARTLQAVQFALDAGYRHIDTSQANEWYCEKAVGKALQLSQVPRQELFLVTKQHPRDHGYERTLTMFKSSLANLHTDYIDLMHLHYPECWGTLCAGTPPEGTWRDAWRALEELHDQGKIRALGVSNFSPEQLQELLAMARIPPAVVQSHSDPLRANTALQRLCAENDVVFTAYSSLGTQHGGGRNPVINNPVIAEVAERLGKSPVQVVLRWALDNNQVIIPRSMNRAHIAENLELDFVLPPMDKRKIDHLDGRALHYQHV